MLGIFSRTQPIDLVTIKDKVTPLLEEAIEKNLGVNIPQLESDITDQLKKPILDIYVPGNLSFKEA